MKNVPQEHDSRGHEAGRTEEGVADEYLERLLEFGRSFSNRAAEHLRFSPRHSGPDCRPGKVSDSWALGGGVLLIALSGLGAFLMQKAC
jgi:hypothetical protein